MAIAVSRRALLALGVGGAAASVCSCQGGDSRKRQPSGTSLRYDGPRLSLTYWNGFTGADSVTMGALVREFNDSQPDISVVTRTYPWKAFYANLHATDQRLGPDVGMMQADHLATEAAAGRIAPLGEVARALQVRAEDFLDQAWRLGTYNGVRYGIPFDVHCLAMFCNRDQLARAGVGEPTDATSLDTVCRKLRDAGYTWPLWMPSGFPALQIFLGLLWQNGGEPYAADVTASTFASEEALTALMW